jgi:hypothetical protein
MMLLCMKIGGGTVAVFGNTTCTMQKLSSKTPANVNKAMIRASFHYCHVNHRSIRGCVYCTRSPDASGRPTAGQAAN